MKECPTCNRRVEWQDNPFRPFCSERCKLVDFGKWVSEEYRVAGKSVATEAREASEDESEGETNSSEE